MVPVKDAPKLNDLVDQQIKDALDAELATKGLTKTDNDSVDLYIGTKPQSGKKNSLPRSVLTGAMGLAGTRLAVDMYDSKATIWCGEAWPARPLTPTQSRTSSTEESGKGG